MPSSIFPTPVLLSLAIAGGVAALELVGWLILCPRFTRLLPFRRPIPTHLPVPTGERRGQPTRGRCERVVWRWFPGPGAWVFRRRVEPGRKPYCIGRLELRADGRWVLSWAPFPFFSWPALLAAWVAVLIGLGWTAMPGGTLVAGVATLLLLLVVAANLHLSRLAFERVVWPEAQQQLEDWLGQAAPSPDPRPRTGPAFGEDSL